MVLFSAAIIDNLVLIFVALMGIYFYRYKKKSLVYKKKWALVISIPLFVYGVYGIYEAYSRHSSNEIPSRTKVEERIEAEGIENTKDITHVSLDGYQLLIPAGYKYTSFKSGRVVLTAVKEHSAVIVARLDSPSSLGEFADDICREFEQKYQNFNVNSRKDIATANSKALRVDCEFEKQGIPVIQILGFFKTGDVMYELSLVCKKETYGEVKQEFEDVLCSFTPF